MTKGISGMWAVANFTRTKVHTERFGSLVSTPASYSESSGYESRSRDQL
jgi:hypothetical protein